MKTQRIELSWGVNGPGHNISGVELDRVRVTASVFGKFAVHRPLSPYKRPLRNQWGVTLVPLGLSAGKFSSRRNAIRFAKALDAMRVPWHTLTMEVTNAILVKMLGHRRHSAILALRKKLGGQSL